MIKLVARVIFAKPLLRCLGLLGGEGFNTDLLPFHLVLRCFVMQKIFGVNRSVPWPVHWTSRIVCPEKIKRGSRFLGLSKCCHIDGRNGIVFGFNVWIGPGAKIISMNHSATNYNVYDASPPISIGDNCWIASDAKVIAGVHLGNHIIVSAGAVVTKSFTGSDLLVRGVPARIIKNLPPY